MWVRLIAGVLAASKLASLHTCVSKGSAVLRPSIVQMVAFWLPGEWGARAPGQTMQSDRVLGSKALEEERVTEIDGSTGLAEILLNAGRLRQLSLAKPWRGACLALA